jgi:threonine 3-dehydrogenase
LEKPKKMKSLAKLKKARGLWFHDAPIPEIGHNDILIKIKKTAICGTDVSIYNWDEWAQKIIRVPMIIGHEFVGEIVNMGEEVKGFKIGDRVSGEGHISCGLCRNCKAGRQHLCLKNVGVGVTAHDGCFAEYLSLPAVNVYPIPEQISDNLAAIFDPFGNATHVALSFDLVGEDVLITGAGPIGIMSAVIARHAGARHIVITEINEYRINLAKKLGFEHVVNVKHDSVAKTMKNLNMQEGFNVGFEMSGDPQAFNMMLEHMNNAGKIALLGFLPQTTTIDWNKIIMKGLLVKGIYGREMFDTWYKMIAMLQSGLNIDPIITHHFHVDDFAKGFEVMCSGNSGKVILDWT